MTILPRFQKVTPTTYHAPLIFVSCYGDDYGLRACLDAQTQRTITGYWLMTGSSIADVVSESIRLGAARMIGGGQ